MKNVLIAGFVALVAFVAMGSGLTTDIDTASAGIACSQNDDDAEFCVERGVNAWLEGESPAPGCSGCRVIEVYVTYECEWGLCRGPGYFWLPPEPPPAPTNNPAYHGSLINQHLVYLRPESGAPYPLFVFTDNGDGNVPGPGNSNPYYQASTVSQALIDGSDGPECSWVRRSPPDDQLLVLRQHGNSPPCLSYQFALWDGTPSFTLNPDDSEVRRDGTVVFGCVSACPDRQAGAQTNSAPSPGNGPGAQGAPPDGTTGGGGATPLSGAGGGGATPLVATGVGSTPPSGTEGEPEALSGFLARLCEWARGQGMEPDGCS